MCSKKIAFLAAAILGGIASAWANPVTFEEISLRIRTGDPAPVILQDITSRKLLKALTPQQEATLKTAGATRELLDGLKSTKFLATQEEVDAYNALEADARKRAAAPVPPATASVPRYANLTVPDLFTESLEAAKKAAPIALGLADAFSLEELEQAKAKAKAERKPLGFVLVAKPYFGKRLDTRAPGGASALVHFYRAFKEPLVLVFVRHELDLPNVPPAVHAGYASPDEGGYSPNMAVVDASASDLIVEIPMGGPGASGVVRDGIFAAGAKKISAWLTQHPTGVAVGAK